MATNVRGKKPAGGGAAPPTKSALRRQREREQRYRTILTAAGTLFAREGYNKAGMEQIANEAEVSVGTVYFYFKNKEDLLLRLLDEIGYELRNSLGTEFKKADGKPEGISRAGTVFFEQFCPHHPEMITIMFRDSVGLSPLVEARRKKIFDKIIGDVKDALDRIEKAQALRYRSRMSSEVMAVCIMGMYERIAYHYLIWQDIGPRNLKTIGRDAVAFILGGLDNLSR